MWISADTFGFANLLSPRNGPGKSWGCLILAHGSQNWFVARFPSENGDIGEAVRPRPPQAPTTIKRRLKSEKRGTCFLVARSCGKVTANKGAPKEGGFLVILLGPQI
jgi:hypothetical protein